MSRLVNFVLYQVGWFACVLGAAWSFPWTGVAISLTFVGVHLWLADDRPAQWKLSAIAAGVGLLVDTAQLWAGVFTFRQGVVMEWLPPLWMTVLWMQFATTFHYSLHWLSRRYVTSGLFGLAGAPVAFFAGERLGAIEFLPPRLLHYGVLAVAWSIAIPLLIFAADQLRSEKSKPPGYRHFRA